MNEPILPQTCKEQNGQQNFLPGHNRPEQGNPVSTKDNRSDFERLMSVPGILIKQCYFPPHEYKAYPSNLEGSINDMNIDLEDQLRKQLFGQKEMNPFFTASEESSCECKFFCCFNCSSFKAKIAIAGARATFLRLHEKFRLSSFCFNDRVWRCFALKMATKTISLAKL